ncbi:MAG: hypothetical protein ABIG44_05595, partial [Planctomycetota bacterium]
MHPNVEPKQRVYTHSLVLRGMGALLVIVAAVVLLLPTCRLSPPAPLGMPPAELSTPLPEAGSPVAVKPPVSKSSPEPARTSSQPGSALFRTTSQAATAPTTGELIDVRRVQAHG